MEIPGITGAFFNCPPPDFSVFSTFATLFSSDFFNVSLFNLSKFLRNPLSEVVNSTSSASSFFEDDFGNSCSFFLNSAGLPNPNTPVSVSFNFAISGSAILLTKTSIFF